MKRTLVCFLSAFTLGCSAFRRPMMPVNVVVAPEDAVVRINGQIYKSPVNTDFPRDRPLVIEVKRDGYFDQRRFVDTHLNLTGVLDLIGTFVLILPGVGLATPGSSSFDEDVVFIEMVRKESKHKEEK